jgi:hypothetical protein
VSCSSCGWGGGEAQRRAEGVPLRRCYWCREAAYCSPECRRDLGTAWCIGPMLQNTCRGAIYPRQDRPVAYACFGSLLHCSQIMSHGMYLVGHASKGGHLRAALAPDPKSSVSLRALHPKP